MTHLLLRSAVDQMNYVFTAYAVSGEGLSGKVDYLITYLNVACDYKASVAAAECVTHRKVL